MSKGERGINMNELEHTFPIPESAVKNLDEVQEQLQNQPLRLKVKDSLRANRWRVLGLVSVMGFLLGICIGRKSCVSGIN